MTFAHHFIISEIQRHLNYICPFVRSLVRQSVSIKIASEREESVSVYWDVGRNEHPIHIKFDIYTNY